MLSAKIVAERFAREQQGLPVMPAEHGPKSAEPDSEAA